MLESSKEKRLENESEGKILNWQQYLMKTIMSMHVPGVSINMGIERRLDSRIYDI